MKKWVMLLVMTVLLAGFLCGCGSTVANVDTAENKLCYRDEYYQKWQLEPETEALPVQWYVKGIEAETVVRQLMAHAPLNILLGSREYASLDDAPKDHLLLIALEQTPSNNAGLREGRAGDFPDFYFGGTRPGGDAVAPGATVQDVTQTPGPTPTGRAAQEGVTLPEGDENVLGYTYGAWVRETFERLYQGKAAYEAMDVVRPPHYPTVWETSRVQWKYDEEQDVYFRYQFPTTGGYLYPQISRLEPTETGYVAEVYWVNYMDQGDLYTGAEPTSAKEFMLSTFAYPIHTPDFPIESQEDRDWLCQVPLFRYTLEWAEDQLIPTAVEYVNCELRSRPWEAGGYYVDFVYPALETDPR